MLVLFGDVWRPCCFYCCSRDVCLVVVSPEEYKKIGLFWDSTSRTISVFWACLVRQWIRIRQSRRPVDISTCGMKLDHGVLAVGHVTGGVFTVRIEARPWRSCRWSHHSGTVSHIFQRERERGPRILRSIASCFGTEGGTVYWKVFSTWRLQLDMCIDTLHSGLPHDVCGAGCQTAPRVPRPRSRCPLFNGILRGCQQRAFSLSHPPCPFGRAAQRFTHTTFSHGASGR